MDIEYERTMDDLIEFHLFHYAHSGSIRRQTLTWRVVMAFLTALLPFGIIFLLYRQVTPLLFLLSLLGGALIFFIYPYLDQKSITGRLKKMLSEGNNQAILGHQAMSLSPEGIFSKSQTGESKLNWASIDKVVQSEKYIFLYISSTNAIVIPTRVFATENQRQEFMSYVTVHVEQKSENGQPRAS